MSSSSPPPKRKRTDSNSDALPASNPAKIGFNNIERNPEFWFDDGSIVLLAADAMAFRVHRTILARRSEVFRDMLLVGDPGAANQERIEGCPVVQLPDDLADVCRLLKALYDPLSFARDTEMTLDERLSYLRIATKYVIPSIREEVLTHLRSLYPSTRSALRESLTMPLPEDSWHDILYAVHAGTTYDIPEILPVAFYKCCLIPPSELIRGAKDKDGNCLRLESTNIIACLAGRFKLLKLRNDVLDAPICSMAQDEDCSGCRSALLDLIRDILVLHHDHLDIFQDAGVYPGLLDHSPLCASCTSTWKEIETDGVDTIWERLPDCFGLAKDWSELLDRAREREGC